MGESEAVGQSGSFPTAPRQRGAHVWSRADVEATPGDWIWTLDDDQVSEMIEASTPYTTGVDDLPTISKHDFPVPAVAERVEQVRENLLHGLGFQVVKGWPVSDLPVRQTAAAVLGLGAHLGVVRSQNAAGHILGHIRDLGFDSADPQVRVYQTNERQTFHTDSTDVVGLLCLEEAESGGQSMLVSAGTIYNEMLDRAPDLAAKLFEPVETDRRGEVPEGERPYFTIPVLNWFAGQLTIMLHRSYIESARRFEDVPPLGDDMIAALDLLDEIANDPRFNLALNMERGDMLFVHNHSMLHDRMAFTNKPGSPRHLLRLWLSVDGDRELPDYYRQRYGSVTVGDRGGIITAQTQMCAPLTPL
ncbi:MAG: TauD/TfdA family dioxygenase [Actinomycetia bacterium]|nr:TauD/TfdA family dioxygenase [Actinomycetes bacterium]